MAYSACSLMSDDPAEGIDIPDGAFVELVIDIDAVYLIDADSGEIYEVWRVH